MGGGTRRISGTRRSSQREPSRSTRARALAAWSVVPDPGSWQPKDLLAEGACTFEVDVP